MAYLVTHHDPYHAHKILGLICLIHFLARLACVGAYGTAFPAESEGGWPRAWQAACVGAHGLLSWSSLLLPLPKKRNFSSPMIWPEFRLHSIVFGTRHVVATVATLLNLWPGAESPLLDAAAKASLVVATVFAARCVTDRFGDRAKRTTNAMPYPPGVGPSEQAGVKRNYSIAQFHATMHCVIGDSTAAFLPLIGIQMAPLLMTLVRKGIVTSFTYHRVYSLALYIPYLAATWRLVLGTFGIYAIVWFGNITMLVVRPMRFQLQLPPEACWAVGALLAVGGGHALLDGEPPEPPVANQLGALGLVLQTHAPMLLRYSALA